MKHRYWISRGTTLLGGAWLTHEDAERIVASGHTVTPCSGGAR